MKGRRTHAVLEESAFEQAPVEAAERIRIARLPTDDEVVVVAAERALDVELRARRPIRVGIVRIDGWFSRRWLHFAGKMLGALRVTSTRLVIPPFVPGRVLDERHLRWAAATYVDDAVAPALHRKQTSAANLRRTLAAGGSSRVVLWLGVSARERRAAAMLYAVGPPAGDAWYMSLAASNGTWDVDFAKPLSVREARKLMALPA